MVQFTNKEFYRETAKSLAIVIITHIVHYYPCFVLNAVLLILNISNTTV